MVFAWHCFLPSAITLADVLSFNPLLVFWGFFLSVCLARWGWVQGNSPGRISSKCDPLSPLAATATTTRANDEVVKYGATYTWTSLIVDLKLSLIVMKWMRSSTFIKIWFCVWQTVGKLNMDGWRPIFTINQITPQQPSPSTAQNCDNLSLTYFRSYLSQPVCKILHKSPKYKKIKIQIKETISSTIRSILSVSFCLRGTTVFQSDTR